MIKIPTAQAACRASEEHAGEKSRSVKELIEYIAIRIKHASEDGKTEVTIFPKYDLEWEKSTIEPVLEIMGLMGYDLTLKKSEYWFAIIPASLRISWGKP